MKRYFPCLLAILFFYTSKSQNFTWLKGLNTSGVISGTLGTQGVPAAANNPGTRHGAATWVDQSGNLWLMGGEGTSTTAATSWLNDLWRYNPSTNEWTWIRGSAGPDAVGVYGTMGVASSLNEPGAREFPVTWTDASGNFWLFGGDGFASTTTFGKLGDLWKYNPTTNQWTWMKGFNTVDQNGVYGTLNVSASTNMPGSRTASATWVDGNGNLWLLGGRGFPSSGGSLFLNDLWKYNIASNNWTWVKGSNAGNQSGIYGTMGVPSTTNAPGAREFPNFWSDAGGNLYLGSGRGYASGASPGYMNDIWRYTPSNDTWTWLNGANTINPAPSFGTMGVSSPGNSPGGRYTAASWRDLQGNFWLFGGVAWVLTSSTNTTPAVGNCSDLWKYDVGTNQWTWMKGSNYLNSLGNYGTLGVSNINNVPGARHYNTWWKEINAQFFFFGGEGVDDTNPVVENLCDLWKYIPPCNPDSVVANPGKLLCSGKSVSLTASNQYPATVQWFNTSTGGSAIASGTNFVTGTLTAATTPSVYNFYAQANACTVTPRTLISMTVVPNPTLSISGSSAVCVGSQGTLTATGATSYTWSNGATGPNTTITPSITSIYMATCSTANNCTATASFSVQVNPLPTLSVSATKTLVCANNHTVGLSASGATTYSWANAGTGSVVVVTPTVPANPGHGAVNYTVTGTDNNGCSNTAAITISVASCTGLSEDAKSAQLRVYPNPNQGRFTIQCSNVDATHFALFNVLGQQLLKEEFSSNKAELELTLDAGCYIIQVYNGPTRLGSLRFVKE